MNNKISYVYEIKLYNNSIGSLIEHNKCSQSGPHYTFENNTQDIKILKIYANVVINNNHSSDINYKYIFNVIDEDINTVEKFTNNWKHFNELPNGHDSVSKEDIRILLNNVANKPIEVAKKYISEFKEQLYKDDLLLEIDKDCDKFNNKPNECNYIENINLKKRDFNMAFSTNNINSLFSNSEIPSPQFIPNVQITNVFNISNIKNYITEEQQSNPSERVPKFTPGGYSLYFKISN